MLVVRPCKDVTIGCVDGQEVANGSDAASGAERPGSVGQVSVRQRLIELEFRNGFRIGGVERTGLIELEDTLGWCPSGRQWRGRVGRSR